MLIRRIDHPILCVRDRGKWVPLIEKVLGIRPSHQREGDEWGFSNAEIAVGDGFIGVVEPSGPESQLHRFLAKNPEGFYACSVDVGDLEKAAALFDERGVPYRVARRGDEIALLWVPPSATHGVLYQISRGMEQHRGANPGYAGIGQIVIAVHDLATAVETYRRVFDFDAPSEVRSEHLGYQGAVLQAGQPSDTIVLAQSTDPDGPVGLHLAARGEGLFQLTIDVTDLPAEMARLAASGVGVAQGAAADGRRLAWIDPDALLGVRVELREQR